MYFIDQLIFGSCKYSQDEVGIKMSSQETFFRKNSNLDKCFSNDEKHLSWSRHGININSGKRSYSFDKWSKSRSEGKGGKIRILLEKNNCDRRLSNIKGRWNKK
jgi:hypothetical protein